MKKKAIVSIVLSRLVSVQALFVHDRSTMQTCPLGFESFNAGCVPTCSVPHTTCAIGAATIPALQCNNLRSRASVDVRMREVATSIKGTEATPLYVIDSFLSPAECSALINQTKQRLAKSPLARQSFDPDFRTSQTAYLNSEGIEKQVDEKMLKVMEVPAESGESPQIQHYNVGDQFKAHYDYFHPGHDDQSLKQGQRTWTFAIYLNDVEEGGHTEFVNMDESLVPKTGRAVVWSNLQSDGSVDGQTMHQGSPVKRGEKYILTKWFRDQCSQ